MELRVLDTNGILNI